MIFAAIALLLLIGLYAAYRVAFYSSPRGRAENYSVIPDGEQYQADKPRMRRLIDDFAALPHERWEIASDDGLRLSARFYPAAPGAPLEIMMHGYRGSAIRDFCGGGKLAMSQGHAVLLVDQRANGESGGCTITFGVKERFDCLAWVREAIRRLGPDVRIVLSGVSMGAATVVTATELELPENVAAVVADCPFSDPAKIIRKVCGDLHLPAGLMMPLVHLSARLFGGFRLGAASAVEAVRHSRIPVLLIHGEDDRFVPCDMSREIHAANPDMVTLLTVPGAGHGLSYIVDTARYERTVRDFLGAILSSDNEV